MDPASTFPPRALNVRPGQRVLDMCAAPGGKSLILAENLFLADGLDLAGELVANEISSARRARLKAVLHDYLPQDLQERWHIPLWSVPQPVSKRPYNILRPMLVLQWENGLEIMENMLSSFMMI
jgi:hypothetical protein